MCGRKRETGMPDMPKNTHADRKKKFKSLHPNKK